MSSTRNQALRRQRNAMRTRLAVGTAVAMVMLLVTATLLILGD